MHSVFVLPVGSRHCWKKKRELCLTTRRINTFTLNNLRVNIQLKHNQSNLFLIYHREYIYTYRLSLHVRRELHMCERLWSVQFIRLNWSIIVRTREKGRQMFISLTLLVDHDSFSSLLQLDAHDRYNDRIFRFIYTGEQWYRWIHSTNCHRFQTNSLSYSWFMRLARLMSQLISSFDICTFHAFRLLI